MPPLKDTRREAFAQKLMARPETGETQAECYEAAGFNANHDSAGVLGSRLANKAEVINRVREMQERIANQNHITLEGVCRELDEAVEIAKSKGQGAALVSAATLRAKLGGLLTDKLEVRKADYSKIQESGDLARQMLYDTCREKNLPPPEDWQCEQAMALLQQFTDDIEATAKRIRVIEHRPVRNS
jgi:hypothetical protein